MSANDFALIRPVAITAAMLTSSVPEPATGDAPDPAAWNAATAYVIGDRVTRTTLHSIYQRAVAGTTATAPEADTINWVRVGATNKWRMFDAIVEAQSSQADSIVVTLTPGVLADRLALLNVQADTARLQVAGTSYDQTIDLRTRYVGDWYDYFFEPFVQTSDVVFSGMPLLTTNVITLTLTRTGSIARCGEAVLGLSKMIGRTNAGATPGIVDYSTKTTDSFGNTAIVKRAFSKRMSVQIVVTAGKVDEIQQLLADFRADPLVWVGLGNLYSSLIVYGFYRRFEIVISYPTHAICSLEIEGLT
jgi:hypothetical protein